MDTNKLSYNDQYGFRPRHSTALAAVRFVTDLIKDMDNYKIPTAVLIDLSKAFDTLNHDILLSKLGYYGWRLVLNCVYYQIICLTKFNMLNI